MSYLSAADTTALIGRDPPAPAQHEHPGAAEPAEPPAAEPPCKLPSLGHRLLTDILDLFCQPFHLAHIELRPGATNGDKTRALALPYVDVRILQKRLNAPASVYGRHAHFEPWGRRA